MPWGNMYEFILSVTFVGSAAWLVVLSLRPAVRHLGLFVTLALVVLLGAAGLIAYTPVGPLVPALHSYWFVIHVSTIILASGILLLGAVPATMFLIKTGYDQGKRRFPYPLGPARSRRGDPGTPHVPPACVRVSAVHIRRADRRSTVGRSVVGPLLGLGP
jgi:hypothetical protein